MNISAPFIKRPVMTTLLVFGLILFGIIGYVKMPVSDLPNVDFPTIQVTAKLDGASPDTMASAVAAPLESVFATIPGVDSMTSSSTLGQTKITIQFALDRSIDSAAQDVQAAISQQQKELPKQMKDFPYYKKVNPADSPVLYITLSSDTLPMSLVDDYAEARLAQRISMLSGVAQVGVGGSQKFAVRVQVDPFALASHQLSFDDLTKAIQNANTNLPTGSLIGDQQMRTLDLQGQLFNAQQFAPLIVAYRDGQPIRLNSVARVIDGIENDQVASWLDHKRAIVLQVYRQPGTNTIAVINKVKKILPRFEASMPKAMQLTIYYDRSITILNSIHEVQFNLITAALLVVLVIFLFLKNFSATFVPSIVLPVTIVGTFAFMSLCNFSIDNISLMGLTLAVGFFVDDAIVMLENILRHMEMGKKAFQAALDGSREISFTIISMTLSLMAAFIPLLFMPGLLGRLLHEFSFTIVISIVISAFVSLTLTPMMASRILTHKEVSVEFLVKFDQWFNASHKFYQKTLARCFQHQRLMILGWFATVALTAVLFILVPKGFIPKEDRGILFGNTEASLDTAFPAMVNLQQQLVNIIERNPAVDNVVSLVNDHSTGRIMVKLKAYGQRASWDKVLDQLHQATQNVPGIKLYLQAPASLIIGGHATNAEYQFTLQDANLDELFSSGNKVLDAIKTLPQVQDVSSDVKLDNPMLHMEVDRDKAASMHIDMFSIQNILNEALGTPQISTIYEQNNQYQVILQTAPEFQKNVEVLNQFNIPTGDNHLVPLSNLVKMTNIVGPQAINHQDQSPAFTVSFNLKPGVSIGQAVNAINEAVSKLQLPITVSTDFQGSAKAFQDSLHGFLILILLAIAVIYILLGILYESFIHPLTILSTLPTAGVGALFVLIMTQVPLDIYGFIGLLMLVGIVKKNAIIMIDFALEAQRKGMTPEAAIYQACVIRFRPIMMTTFAAFMGALPIVFAVGAGATARRSLGLTVAGGLLTSQILTLYSTPIIYLYLERFQAWLKRA